MKLEQTVPIWGSRDFPRFPNLTSPLTTQVCVVGGGIAGLSTAYHLLKAGIKVVVLERDEIGSGQTGRTTAHLSHVLDRRFFALQKLHGRIRTKEIVESHLAGINQIEKIVTEEGIDCDFARVNGYLFCESDQEARTLRKELSAIQTLGMGAVSWTNRIPLLSNVSAAIEFPQQAQFSPLKYLFALASRITQMGGQIFSNTSVAQVESRSKSHVEVFTESGHRIDADAVVLATNVPINTRFAIHTKQYAYRTFAMGFQKNFQENEKILAWDIANPYHYIRTRGDTLILGGEDHRTGQENSDDTGDADAPHRRLEAWGRERITGLGGVTSKWSGQVIEPVDGVAFIGKSPNAESDIYVVTGHSGNGLTVGSLAGSLLTDLILGRENAWSKVYDPRRVSLKSSSSYLRENSNTALQYRDWFKAGDTSDIDKIPPGSGAVVNRGLKKTAIYRDVHGGVCEMSAVCPHLYGVVRWNDLEKTWDCPCHGSRFDRYGSLIQGPAISDLEKSTPLETAQEKSA